ncbi:MAG TPA: hypothetical protein VFJ13_10420, partial [Paracoccaceae bacterium]|nr:hypothetical protein [Paracoccaceae bacterium]
MTAPFPFDTWARPGKDAFEFWISFFPTAPMFGVEWRFADMMHPAMSPFTQAGSQAGIQAGPVPFPMAFPGTSAAAAAARPGELDSPARADDGATRPLAKAAETTAGVVEDAGRLTAETGRAAARAAEAAMQAGGRAARVASKGADGKEAQTLPAARAAQGSLATAGAGSAAQKLVTGREAVDKRSGDALETSAEAVRKAAGAVAPSAKGADGTDA